MRRAARDLTGDRAYDRGSAPDVVFAVTVDLRETPEILRDVGSRASQKRLIIVGQV